jgi:hypothetical protein
MESLRKNTKKLSPSDEYCKEDIFEAFGALFL